MLMEAQMLKDKVAIITGASYGMGQTMAEVRWASCKRAGSPGMQRGILII